MAIHDFYQVLADGQDLAGGYDGQVSEHTVDWDESPARKGGHPRPIWFEVYVTTAFVGGGDNSGLRITVQNADGATGDFKDILIGPDIPLAQLTVGAVFQIPYPLMGLDDDDNVMYGGPNQVLRLKFDSISSEAGNWTAGTIDAVLTGG